MPGCRGRRGVSDAVSEKSVTRRRDLPLLALLFVASGATALVYQVAWERMLGIFSGIHLYSITLIVGAYMAGLGFGSLFGGRLADRLDRRSAVLGFALCELGIGLFALVSPWVYYDLTQGVLAPLAGFPALLPAVHFLLLLPPTLLMGASLPLLSRGLVRETKTAANTIAVLYGCNTLGAAAGASATAWYLLGAFGLSGSVRLAAVVNLLIAVVALALLRFVERDAVLPTETPGALRTEPIGFASWCWIYGLSGFVALSLEVLWLRVLHVAIKASPYTFGHLLGLFLGFMALGSLAGTLFVTRLKRPDLVFLWGQWAVSVSAGLGILFLVAAPLENLGWKTLPQYWGLPEGIELAELGWSLENWGERRATFLVSRMAQVYLALPVLLVALPTFLMGFTFPCIQRIVQTDLRRVGRRVGTVQASNILGSILGSVLTGAVLLDLLGTPRTLALLLVLGSVFVVVAALRRATSPSRIAAAGALVVSLSLAFAIPSEHGFWARLHGSKEADLIVAERASGVAALRFYHPTVALQVNGRINSAMPYSGAAVLFALVPALLHPNPEKVFVVGLGTGRTVWSLAAEPRIESIDVFELVRGERTVLETYSREHGGYLALSAALSDPRISVTHLDARLALRIQGRRYDLIQADPLATSMAYSGNIYSREFFRLCRSRLEPQGLFVTAIPTERTLRTLVSEFPFVLDFHSRDFASFAVASNEPFLLDQLRLLERFRSTEVRRHFQDSGELESVREQLMRFLDQVETIVIDESNRDAFTRGNVNTDLFPRDEFDKSFDSSYR